MKKREKKDWEIRRKIAHKIKKKKKKIKIGK